MSGTLADYGNRTFELIDELRQTKTCEQVIDGVARSLSEFGFEHFVATHLPGYHERFEQTVISRKWPVGWFEIYTREDYVRVDPVIRRCRKSVQPFKWTQLRYDSRLGVCEREVMDRASEFGMQRGFSLPIHGPDGYGGCFSMSGTHPDLDYRIEPVIHVIAMFAFDRIWEITQPQHREQKNLLTGREQEVLRWAAAGKSASCIAATMKITERTVTFHTVNAMRKLGATNKTQAVAYALQRGLFQL